MPHDLQLWCEDCQKGYDGECEKHGPLTHVNDTEIGTKARRSLPCVLELKEERNQIGVFARETLAKRLQFGPLQGLYVKEPNKQIQIEDEVKNKYGIVYKLVQDDEDLLLIDTRFEEHSNWMLFVRPAETKSEQNLIAFQYKGEIFFATIKEIPAFTELKVWFSKDYAERMGAKILSEDSPSWQFRTRPRFCCAGCEVVFSTSSSLANHRCSKNRQSLKSEGFPSRKRGKRRYSSSAVKPFASDSPPSIEASVSGKVKEKSATQLKTSTKAITLKAKEKKPGIKVKEESKFLVIESDTSSSEEIPEPKVTPSKGSYQCSTCQKIFHSPGKLKQHSYSHTGERPFSCPHCQKAFSSRFKLGRHQLIHTGVRQHQCPLCNRSFHRKDHLKNHIQIHDPKKQFKCERSECGKEYNSYMSYRKHCAVHAAEEGDLECKICFEMFDNKTDLIYHLKVHVGTRTVKSPSEKKFQCDHCERRFFTRKDVKRHLVVHTGKRDFVCSICPQKFGRKDHLVRHIKKSHGISDPSRSMESSDPISIAGPSSAPQALSPEAGLMSSTSASSGDQSFSSLLMGESMHGQSSMTSSSPLPSKAYAEPSSETYEGGTFPGVFRFFEEGIKEEPELTASIIDPGGDDISKILGMYLPSGSINLQGPPLLDCPDTSLTPSHLRPLHISHDESDNFSSSLLMGSASFEGESGLIPTQLMSEGAASEDLSHTYHLPSESLLESPDTACRVSAVDTPETREGEETVISSSITTTTTTTSTSSSSSLPGFDQAFP